MLLVKSYWINTSAMTVDIILALFFQSETFNTWDTWTAPYKGRAVFGFSRSALTANLGNLNEPPA